MWIKVLFRHVHILITHLWCPMSVYCINIVIFYADVLAGHWKKSEYPPPHSDYSAKKHSLLVCMLDSIENIWSYIYFDTPFSCIAWIKLHKSGAQSKKVVKHNSKQVGINNSSTSVILCLFLGLITLKTRFKKGGEDKLCCFEVSYCILEIYPGADLRGFPRRTPLLFLQDVVSDCVWAPRRCLFLLRKCLPPPLSPIEHSWIHPCYPWPVISPCISHNMS